MGKKEREREGKGKTGAREVRATSRTICPGWPRRGGRKGMKIEEDRGREKSESPPSWSSLKHPPSK